MLLSLLREEFVMLALVLVWTVAQETGDPPFLEIDHTIEASIENSDPHVQTPILANYTDALVVGKSYLIQVDERGTYTIDLRSYFFDTYLVLRDDAGDVMAEDDDGLLSTHSRIVQTLAPEQVYLLEACALHGDRGPFELRLSRGEAPRLSAQERTEAERADRQRGIELIEELKGPESPELAIALNLQGQFLYSQRDFAAARPYLERACAISEKAFGPVHRHTASSLNNLAQVLRNQGDYAAARPLLERALAIGEALGPENPDTASTLHSLAALLRAQGDLAAARPYLERALAIYEKAYGPEHPEVATTLNNLGWILNAQGDYDAARPYLERALAINEKALPDDPVTAANLGNMANVLRDRGEYAEARQYLERAVAIYERTLGPEHLDTTRGLNNLARLLREQGDYAGARSLFERSVAIREKALGPEHPDTAMFQYYLALSCADEDLDSAALLPARAAMTSSLAHARKVLWSLSEHERLLYVRNGELYLRLFLSLSAMQPAASAAETYEFALNWRGLVSRSLLESRDHMRSSVPERAGTVLADLQRVQADLSKQLYMSEVVDPEAHERAIRGLRERRNELEVELQRLAGPSVERPVNLAELQGALEPGSAFVDFLAHPLYERAVLDGEKVVRKGDWTQDHLSVWIVRPDRELAHLDLGETAPIEAEVKAWLEELVSRRGVSLGEKDAEKGARLRELLWKPLSVPLDGVRRIFLHPDSFLGTLPFEVIPLEDGRYLVEELSFVYVQTPSALLKKASADGAPSTLLVAGGIDFKNRAGIENVATQATPLLASTPRGDELRGSLHRFWSRLPLTEHEAQTVHDLFETAFPSGERLVLTAEAATEERLKRELMKHSIVHLATHGFFNPEGTVSMWDSAREQADGNEPLGLEREAQALVGQFPGLLTGLVCAGANEPAPEGRDDGLLTAEEVLWLDLSKVELVVLSACETALGERRAGEGMIGLRRAFGLAGAKTVVSSLWSVKDTSTSELMQLFYENLWLKKQGRAEALRNAQLEILAKNRAGEHDPLPSTWGAFVLSGDWR